MSRPLTDRERILALEAENAALREELAAWRAGAAEDADDERAALRLSVVKGVLKGVLGSSQQVKGAARLLIYMLDRPGRLCRKLELFDVLGAADDARIETLGVRVSVLRAALRRMGFPRAIRNVWGEGYLLEASQAPAIAKLAEPCDG